jgi:hypothetical protein
MHSEPVQMNIWSTKIANFERRHKELEAEFVARSASLDQRERAIVEGERRLEDAKQELLAILNLPTG